MSNESWGNQIEMNHECRIYNGRFLDSRLGRQSYTVQSTWGVNEDTFGSSGFLLAETILISAATVAHRGHKEA